MLLSTVPASPGGARQVLVALALITPLFTGVALSRQRAQPPWWVVPLSGALIGLVNLLALYVGGGPPVRWVNATFWLGVMGALLAIVGDGARKSGANQQLAGQEAGWTVRAASPETGTEGGARAAGP